MQIDGRARIFPGWTESSEREGEEESKRRERGRGGWVGRAGGGKKINNIKVSEVPSQARGGNVTVSVSSVGGGGVEFSTLACC